MKILHVIDSEGMYGAEAVLLNLMVCQQDKGLSPVLLSLGDTTAGPKSIESEAKRRHLEVQTCRFRNGLNVRGAFRILDCARHSQSEIIHSHGYKGNILLGMIPRSLRKIPVLTTLHGWTATRLLSKIWVYGWVDAFSIRRLERAVAVSSTMLQHPHLKWLGIRPELIHNGIPVLNFEPDGFERDFPDISTRIKNRFRIVSIGRLSSEKGYDILIRSLGELISQGIDAVLVLMGEGSEKEKLTLLAKKQNLWDRVYFTGYIDRAYRYLPFFDLFTLSSYTEGMPITLLEAMQSNVPIVATHVGDVPEVLAGGESGYLLPPGDTETLAETIKRVYESREEAKRKGLLAKERALNYYNVERMAEKYFEVYQSLLQN
jgi:glycosyltransferase involved in cell wall biosynthesis